jgi:glucose-6-phosphate 1-dehydrogenase
MRGDATLFTRRDKVDAEWPSSHLLRRPVEAAWAKLPAPFSPNYAAGTDGQIEADQLIADDHRVWHRLTNSPVPGGAVIHGHD